MSLNQSIDFDILNKFLGKNQTTIDLEFHIELKDHGQPPLSSQAKLILRIHDLNDNSPEFNKNQSYNWTYSQSILQPNSILGRIIAHDNDSGLQGLVHYSIHSFNPCLILNITLLGYIYIPFQSSCSLSSYKFEITASDYDPINSRSTKQFLTINIHSNLTNNNLLPKLFPLSIQRTTVDINTQGNIAFIIDLTTLNNHTYQPMIYLNNKNLFSCWNISSTGEVRLIGHPFASSYILSLDIIDDYTKENSLRKFQIDICNSSILNSCQLFSFSDNRIILIYAISLALMITFLCIIIFSIIICLCCRKSQHKNDKLTSIHQQSFLQCNDEKVKKYLHSNRFCFIICRLNMQVINIKVHRIPRFEMMIVCLIM
jgi:hypothetical protein